MSIFDTYICKEPAGDVPLLMKNGPDEYTRLLRTLQRSAEYFAELDRPRVVERIQYEQAQLHIQYQQWKHARRILLPLWRDLSWRKSGWWMLLQEVDLALQHCAKQEKDAELLICIAWELQNHSMMPVHESQTDFATAIESLQGAGPRPKIILKADGTLSPIIASFAFAASYGNVGLPLPSQLSLQLRSHRHSQPPTIESVHLTFSGNFNSILIAHEPSLEPTRNIAPIELQDVPLTRNADHVEKISGRSKTLYNADAVFGKADLVLHHNSLNILCLSHIPREAQDLSLSKISVSFAETQFDAEWEITDAKDMHQDSIFALVDSNVKRIRPTNVQSTEVQVLPKPPKIELELPGPDRDMFVDELSLCSLNVVNGEDEDINVRLDIEVHSPSGVFPTVKWTEEQKEGTEVGRSDDEITSFKKIGRLLLNESQTHVITVDAPPEPLDCKLVVNAEYHLKSDPETQILKVLKKDISIRQPLSAAHEFTPLLHPDPWPNPFTSVGEDPDGPRNNSNQRKSVQRFLLLSKIVSQSSTELTIESTEVVVQGVQEGTSCIITCRDHPSSVGLRPGQFEEFQFVVDVQSSEMEMEIASYVDLQLKILWLASGAGRAMVTSLPIQRLIVRAGEPRVLACVQDVQSIPSAYRLSYWVENPSSYCLNFTIAMETREEFAFCGPKSHAMQLVPMSRQALSYILLPLVKGTWITPNIRVHDTIFDKILAVHGTEGIRNEDRSTTASLWIDAEG